MNILVTGVCGFVGSALVRAWLEHGNRHQFWGVDNFSRPGSEVNRVELRRQGVRLQHGDLRCASDFDTWPVVDVVIDAAANPSVLAGVDGTTSSRQLVEHNLVGTFNLLEYCRRHQAACVLLSTSRVYSIAPLANLPVRVCDGAFVPDTTRGLPDGLTSAGVSERFTTTPPVSLYGATKLASEQLALEYGATFGFPVWVNRCGVMAGAGQFGRADQGIFAYWINAWLRGRPLQYIGFGGEGYQVRDCLHPADLVPLIDRQITGGCDDVPGVVNVGGGSASAISLRQLSAWCRDRFADRPVTPSVEPRPFDIPWMVLDTALAAKTWGWAPQRTTIEILEGIAQHAVAQPDWLEISQP